MYSIQDIENTIHSILTMKNTTYPFKYRPSFPLKYLITTDTVHVQTLNYFNSIFNYKKAKTPKTWIPLFPLEA